MRKHSLIKWNRVGRECALFFWVSRTRMCGVCWGGGPYYYTNDGKVACWPIGRVLFLTVSIDWSR